MQREPLPGPTLGHAEACVAPHLRETSPVHIDVYKAGKAESGTTTSPKELFWQTVPVRVYPEGQCYLMLDWATAVTDTRPKARKANASLSIFVLQLLD